MKKYPDNSEVYRLKEKRRAEVEKLAPIERIKIARRLQKMARLIPKQKPTRDPNWSVKSGRPSAKRKLA